jgi:hypothetical protein
MAMPGSGSGLENANGDMQGEKPQVSSCAWWVQVPADFELSSCLFPAHFQLFSSSETAHLTVLNAGFKLTPGAKLILWLPFAPSFGEQKGVFGLVAGQAIRVSCIRTWPFCMWRRRRKTASPHDGSNYDGGRSVARYSTFLHSIR